MLERRDNPRWKQVSKPSEDALRVLALVLDQVAEPEIAEIGVGVGATSVELARKMDGHGRLHLFDYDNRIKALRKDLAGLGFDNVVTYGNSRATYDSYAWNLAKLAGEVGPTGIFDFAYLDGAHSFVHDAPATVLLMRLVRPGGYLLVDDYDWTFANSPTLNPKASPLVASQYTQEQLEVPHVKLVCELFLDPSEAFLADDLEGTLSRHRRLYRRRPSTQTGAAG